MWSRPSDKVNAATSGSSVFALETEDQRFRATVKLEKKHCDLMVSNGPGAIDASDNHVELLKP